MIVTIREIWYNITETGQICKIGACVSGKLIKKIQQMDTANRYGTYSNHHRKSREHNRNNREHNKENNLGKETWNTYLR